MGPYTVPAGTGLWMGIHAIQVRAFPYHRYHIPTLDPVSSRHASPLLVRQNSKHNYVQPERFWPERWEAGGAKDGGGEGRPVGEHGSTMDAVSDLCDGEDGHPG